MWVRGVLRRGGAVDGVVPACGDARAASSRAPPGRAAPEIAQMHRYAHPASSQCSAWVCAHVPASERLRAYLAIWRSRLPRVDEPPQRWDRNQTLAS